MQIAPQSLTIITNVGHNRPMTEASIIRETLIEERDRNQRAQRAYEAECAHLPRGSVTNRVRGNKSYCYLRYREGKKIRTDYVGRTEQVEEALRRQVARRKELEAVIARLKREERFIEKALRHS